MNSAKGALVVSIAVVTAIVAVLPASVVMKETIVWRFGLKSKGGDSWV